MRSRFMYSTSSIMMGVPAVHSWRQWCCNIPLWHSLWLLISWVFPVNWGLCVCAWNPLRLRSTNVLGLCAIWSTEEESGYCYKMAAMDSTPVNKNDTALRPPPITEHQFRRNHSGINKDSGKWSPAHHFAVCPNTPIKNAEQVNVEIAVFF